MFAPAPDAGDGWAENLEARNAAHRAEAARVVDFYNNRREGNPAA
jgi:hypothetical protein